MNRPTNATERAIWTAEWEALDLAKIRSDARTAHRIYHGLLSKISHSERAIDEMGPDDERYPGRITSLANARTELAACYVG